MRDPRVTGGFLKIVKAEDQEAWNGSFVDGTDNSQSNIEWIYGSPEFDLLTNMEIEAAHCAFRHQAGGLNLFELVHAGDNPIPSWCGRGCERRRLYQRASGWQKLGG